MTDEQIDQLEAALIEDDFAGPQNQLAVERARRRLADQRYVEEMEAEKFTGPATEIWKAEAAAYGLAVMMGWTRTGQIVQECKAKGRPIFLAEFGPGRWSREDRLELAGETVSKALAYFINDVLAHGRWDHRKGASLKTFFIGACLFQFPNVYNAWARGQNRWGRTCDVSVSPDEVEVTAPPAQVRWDDPTSDEGTRRALRRHALDLIADPVTRSAVALIMRGLSINEAARTVGLKEKTLRTRLARLKGVGVTTRGKAD
ncbi:hypothetical protein [Actinomadura sp. GTD37]|uniref:hypothetical protein n=1 Tax=Actinomadura sp. GTD37 TaxID=1778030 RepID=UPI0035BF7F4B